MKWKNLIKDCLGVGVLYKMNKKGDLVGAVVIFILFIMVAIIIGLIFINGIHYEIITDGKHTGTITAIEKSGLIFKTITVYFKSDAQSSQEDTYCLIDESLLPSLESYSINKSKVTISYNDYFINGYKYCGDENGGIIIGVK